MESNNTGEEIIVDLKNCSDAENTFYKLIARVAS